VVFVVVVFGVAQSHALILIAVIFSVRVTNTLSFRRVPPPLSGCSFGYNKSLLLVRACAPPAFGLGPIIFIYWVERGFCNPWEKGGTAGPQPPNSNPRRRVPLGAHRLPKTGLQQPRAAASGTWVPPNNKLQAGVLVTPQRGCVCATQDNIKREKDRGFGNPSDRKRNNRLQFILIGALE